MKYQFILNPENITIKVYRNLNEIGDSFLVLYKTVFQREYSLELFKWYEQLSGENIWAIAQQKSTDKFVGLYNLMPLKCFLRGDEINGYLCHNVGVVSQYLGRGLFQYLGKTILNNTLKNGEFAIAFPNMLALRGHLMVGWQDLGKMFFYMKKSFNEYNTSEFDNIYEIQSFSDNIDQFILKICNQAEFAVKKDHDFLNWRISKPYHNYINFVYEENGVISGYMILKNYFDQIGGIVKCHIIELQAGNKNIFISMLRKAETFAKLSKAKVLNIWIFNSNSSIKYLIDEGFYKTKDVYDCSFLIYVCGDILRNKLNQLDETRITLSLADNDVF